MEINRYQINIVGRSEIKTFCKIICPLTACFTHEWQNACNGQWRDLHLVIEYYLSLIRLVCEQSEIHHQNILGIHCNEHWYCQSAKNEHWCCFFRACSQLFHVGLKLVHHPFLLLNHLLLLLGDGFCQIYWQSP
ncbi:hypothetical protein PthstB1num2_28310 [Parageobacillus thermoglucosidasius]|nr:hypothetical protein Geoth_3728 [Parageobacillus thermoglucosidasius C56-YS93]GMO00791.1 hypothetical protein PthstB1num2_28310 [Parageobacillus thermoglucosidasius]